MSVIIQYHLIRYQHHLITYPRTSHSMKGVMPAHPAQWVKAKICTLVFGQGFRCRLVDCFCKTIARNNKAVLSLHHCLIEQGLIWCLVQAKLSLLICQCWACSVNACLFASKSIMWMYWLKRIFFFNSWMYIINGWIKHSSYCLSGNGGTQLDKKKST